MAHPAVAAAPDSAFERASRLDGRCPDIAPDMLGQLPLLPPTTTTRTP